MEMFSITKICGEEDSGERFTSKYKVGNINYDR